MPTAEINTAEAEVDSLEGGDELFSAIDQIAAGEDLTTSGDDTGDLPLEKPPGTGGDTQPGDSKAPGEKDAPVKKDEQAKKEEPESGKKDGDYPAEIKSTKAREHFDTLKKQKDDAVRNAQSLETRLRTLEAENKQIKGTAGTASPEFKALEKEVTTLKQQLEEKDGILSYKAVEEMTPFKEGVIKPKKEADDDINQLIESYKLNGALIDRAIAEPNKFRRLDLLEEAAAAEGVPETKIPTIVGALKEAAEKWIAADKTEQQLRANAKGNRETVESQQREEEAKKTIARQRDFEKATADVEQILRKASPELFEPEGDVEEKMWKEIQSNAAKIKDLDKLPAKAKVFNNFAANAYQPLVNLTRSLKAKVAELEKTIAEREAGLPGAGGGRTPGAKGAGGSNGDELDDETTLMDLIE